MYYSCWHGMSVGLLIDLPLSMATFIHGDISLGTEATPTIHWISDLRAIVAMRDHVYLCPQDRYYCGQFNSPGEIVEAA